MNIVIVTGASSGIGQEFALQIDSMFHDMDEIWLLARRKDRMEELRKTIRTKCRIFQMDVTDSLAISQFKELLTLCSPKICMLVQCAGFGLLGNFSQIPIEKQLSMIQVNCEALTQIAYLCLPYMKKNGRIIHMASSAAFLAQKSFAVYAASKSYVLSFSRALAEECRKDQIFVTAVCPGPVDTAFFDIAEKYGKTLAIKKLVMISSKKVVSDALRDSFHKKQVSVCSFPMKSFQALTKFLPHSFLFLIMRFYK